MAASSTTSSSTAAQRTNYWLVVNAGNREKTPAWVESHLSGDVDYRDEGNDWGQIALQGPKSGDILKKLCDKQYIPAKYYTFTEDVPLNLGERTIRALVSQTATPVNTALRSTARPRTPSTCGKRF